MASYRARLKEFEDLLSRDEVDLLRLRKMCLNGCPDDEGIRSTCWKILLKYLGSRPGEWSASAEKQRRAYREFVEEMIIIPGRINHHGDPQSPCVEDHPLNPSPDSQWLTYFKDNEMLMQIDKDCRRLYPGFVFFQQATEHPCEELVSRTSNIENLRRRVEVSALKSETVQRNRSGNVVSQNKKRASSDCYMTLEAGQEAHWEVVERILFIYAKLNPGQGYVQGMNEILGPIYYAFATDPRPDWRAHAEADCFFCFTHLMAQIRDNFIKSLDDSAVGIGSLMQRLVQKLRSVDVRLYSRLQELNLKPEFYAFRWLTLLLSQEFQLPDVLRVWDSLLAVEDLENFLLNLCCAMLVLIRDDLLAGDFPTVMKLVQSYPLIDVQRIISKALEISSIT